MSVQRVKASGTNLRQSINDHAERGARAVGVFVVTPNRANVAFESLLIGMWLLYPTAFVVTAVVVALALDLRGGHHVTNGVTAGHLTYKRRDRLRKAGKKFPTIRAIHRSFGVTTKTRRQSWLTTTCERIGYEPAVRYVNMQTDDAGNELWDVRVPITRASNPSIFARPGYEAGFRGCVKGKCYGVNINASNDRTGIAHIYITRTDITSIVAGPAPILTAYPTSIGDPLQIGINAVRKPRMLDLIERNGIGIFGMPGTGKSTLLHTIIAHAVAAPDATVFLADLKDGIDGEAWEHATIYTESVLEVRQWIARYCRRNDTTFAYTEYATERARHLKKLGVRKWHPGCGINAELLIIDEIDNLTDKDQHALAWMNTKLRAIGVRVIFATQLPRADTLDKRLSDSLNIRISFAVDNVTAAGIALGIGAVGRGYDASLLPMPGYCLVKDAQERDASMVRTHILSVPQVERIARTFPLELPTETGPASETDTNRTVQGGAMEGLPETGRPVSDWPPLHLVETVDPPADAVADPKRMALWEAMPGQRKRLCEASGYGPSQASAILDQWRAEGKCWQIGIVWHHRGAPAQPRNVS